MRVTVLMENSTPSSRLAARHGLSLWLELDDGRRVLFDMGPNDGFLANARSLGVDVTEADLAVVSHGHYDHGGGLGAFLAACGDAGRDVPVYVRGHAFEEHVSGTPERHHAIGLDPALATDPRVRPTGERCDLGGGLALFSTARRVASAGYNQGKSFPGGLMQVVGALLALLLVAFVVSLVISFLVNIVAGALSILPAIFVIVVIWFLVRGGRIHIEFPDRRDRR